MYPSSIRTAVSSLAWSTSTSKSKWCQPLSLTWQYILSAITLAAYSQISPSWNSSFYCSPALRVQRVCNSSDSSLGSDAEGTIYGFQSNFSILGKGSLGSTWCSYLGLHLVLAIILVRSGSCVLVFDSTKSSYISFTVEQIALTNKTAIESVRNIRQGSRDGRHRLRCFLGIWVWEPRSVFAFMIVPRLK